MAKVAPSVWELYFEAVSRSNLAFKEMMDTFKRYGESHSEDIFVSGAVRRYRSAYRITRDLFEKCIASPSDYSSDQSDEDNDEQESPAVASRPIQEGENCKGSLRKMASRTDPEYVMQLYNAGFTIERIVKSTRLTPRQITTILYARGAMNEFRRSPHYGNRKLYDKNDAAEMLRLFRSGLSHSDIALRFGVSRSQVNNWLIRYRKEIQGEAAK